MDTVNPSTAGPFWQGYLTYPSKKGHAHGQLLIDTNIFARSQLAPLVERISLTTRGSAGPAVAAHSSPRFGPQSCPGSRAPIPGNGGGAKDASG